MSPTNAQVIMDLKILAPVSHAHEDPVPGTVYLRPEEGDKTAFGQSLFPVPTLDPNDPVRWPLWRKYIYLFCVIFFTLLGNSSCLTPSVFFVPWSIEFDVPVTQVTDVQNYAILTYGLVNLLWVPLALKFGRRPTWLAALTIWWVLYLPLDDVYLIAAWLCARPPPATTHFSHSLSSRLSVLESVRPSPSWQLTISSSFMVFKPI
jgi:hypothetical protein